MKRRTARRGPNTGGEFWGCSDYPQCRGTVSIERSVSENAVPHAPPKKRVSWTDGTTRREGLTCSYVNAGGSLRSLGVDNSGWRLTRQAWMAEPQRRPGIDPSLARVAGVMRKIVQRGSAPPLDVDAERALLERFDLEKDLQKSGIPGDLAGTLPRPPRTHDFAASVVPRLSQFTADSHLALDSDEEDVFLRSWVPANLGPTAARYLIPQAPLDLIVAAHGGASLGHRRIDFLACAPWMAPFAIEIDGGQHESQTDVDADRDAVLRTAGVDVVRVTTEELRVGSGPGLQDLAARWQALPGSDSSFDPRLLWAAPQTHRAVLALLAGVTAGHLSGRPWTIEIADSLDIVDITLPAYIRLLASIDRLWAGNIVPPQIELRVNGRSLHLASDGSVTTAMTRAPRDADLRIALEHELTSNDELPDPADLPTITVRSAFLPVELRTEFYDGERSDVRSEGEATEQAARIILRSVFAKDDFREGQLDALFELLEGRDCAVLLPTGGGKSLIYQLAGLCLPGRTVVVDPLIALMEDQVNGLSRQGIDRVAMLSGYQTKLGLGESVLDDIRSGEALFIFVAPERFQNAQFRTALESQSRTNPVNLSVVDEAHCVSEWGHDFRPAYLNLGRVLRSVCKDARGRAAPVLALTGTASRAVLRDVLVELEIDRSSERAVIRPRTFDRAELKFSIVRTEPAQAQAALTSAVASLPRRLGIPESEFFAARGRDTYSGIVFCPHASGQHGVGDVAKELAAVGGVPPVTYSGGAPKGFSNEDGLSWEQAKRRNARSFMDDRSPVLVSTKAFGMGIDKPNVRFVVHYGLPGSIESYYQEVGRAGRDRQPAECVLVLIEYDEDRARQLLGEDTSLENTRDAAKVRRREADDISRQLFFHLNSFGGVRAELAHIQDLLDELPRLGERATVEIPMDGQTVNARDRERAIYRLAILGVVRDYLVEWGSRRFVLELAHLTPDAVKDKLLRYVDRNTPARRESVAAQLTDHGEPEFREAVMDSAEALVGYVYDTVERSRRRSLREMWLAARDSAADPNRLFRARILEYLSEGDLSPVLEALVDRPAFDFADWREPLEGVQAGVDAKELRGNAARMLAAYPDHPGLLLARGWSELVDADGDLREFRSNTASALESARDRYDVGEEQLNPLSRWMLASARKRASATAGLVEAFEDAGLWTSELERTLEDALRLPGQDSDLREIALGRSLRRATVLLDDVLASVA